jgi:hypothetical protein
MKEDDIAGAHPVPDGRLDRMLRLGGLTTGILGDMMAEGFRQAARGERPSLPGALLTPATATRITRDLGRMRGAAMKLGQMLALDPGTVLPPEMTQVLAALGADAPHMPPKQLRAVLDAAWGEGWYSRFARFDVRPFAAASIGQVHRAVTREGETLAVKVQYPGVRASIDSDLDNLAALLRLPGLLPRGMDLGPMLAEAKRQLHREADYAAEARHLEAFGRLLAGDARFRVPELHGALGTPEVLAMRYVESEPIDTLAGAPQALRDRVAADLIDLVLRELFVFGAMQTDPNLANYRFEPGTGRIVLLDFGAVMEVEPGLADEFPAAPERGARRRRRGDARGDAQDRLFRCRDGAKAPGRDHRDVPRRDGAHPAGRALRLRPLGPDRDAARHGARARDRAGPHACPAAGDDVPSPQDRRDLPSGGQARRARGAPPDRRALSLSGSCRPRNRAGTVSGSGRLRPREGEVERAGVEERLLVEAQEAQGVRAGGEVAVPDTAGQVVAPVV